MACGVCKAHSIICGGCGQCLKHCTCPPPPGPGIRIDGDVAKEPDRTGTIVCCNRGRRQTCHFCVRFATKLCDFPLTGKKAGQTCDLPICDQCAYHLAPEIDYCPPHFHFREKQHQEMRAKVDAEMQKINSEESQ